MQRASWAERLRYSFDNFMARGTFALVLGLLAISASIIVTFALVIAVLAADDATRLNLDFPLVLWRNLVRTLDSGAVGEDEGSPIFVASALVVTFAGLFVASALIGIISNGLDARLAELRKGRSRVIEEGHVVILGWSQQVFPIIAELIEAHANQRRSRIVVLAEHDKAEMDDAIRARVGRMRKTRVVCRSGSPIDSDDIDIANVQTSRSIIVLSPDSPNPDADVIKTLLAITNDKNRRSAPYHIVAEIREAPNVQVAQMVGGQEVEVVAGPDVVARITAQACGQPGLSVVYTQLLDFGGNDIYFTPVSELTGSTFGEALARFSESSVIGIKSKGQPPRLNPVGETRLGNGDQLVVISEDDDTIKLSDPPLEPAADEAIVAPERGAKPPGRTLLLGWNRGAFAVVSELARYVPPGSTMTVVAEGDSVPSEVEKAAEASAGLAVTFRFGDTTDRATLEALDIAAYDHVIVLCYSDTLDVQRADARTLVTLLHLRDIASKADRRFAIVSEMLDLRNRNLAEVAQADDFIVSDRLVSLLVTQVAENKDLNAVFRDLFDAAGSEVYIKPAADYVKMGQPLSFYTVLESARRRGEVAFGYWLNARANDPMAGFGVVINPVKGTTVTFDSGDRVIVLAAS